MIVFASFPRKPGQNVAKKAHKEIFMSKKRASKDTAKLCRKKNQNPRHAAIFAPLREALLC